MQVGSFFVGPCLGQRPKTLSTRHLIATMGGGAIGASILVGAKVNGRYTEILQQMSMEFGKSFLGCQFIIHDLLICWQQGHPMIHFCKPSKSEMNPNESMPTRLNRRLMLVN